MKTWTLILCIGIVFILYTSPIVEQESAWYKTQNYFSDGEFFETVSMLGRSPPLKLQERQFL
jgi:hypothetical protein